MKPTTRRFKQAMKLRDLLNQGVDARPALALVGIPDTEDEPVYGEDIGDECLDIEDAINDVIDLGWTEDGDGFPAIHHQVRRLSRTEPWCVEVMQRFEPAKVAVT